MNLTELASPIRIYWDIGPARDGSVPDYAGIAGEIAANKILSLQITETAPALSRACGTILTTLKEKPIAVSIVAPLAVLDAQAMELFKRSGVKVVFAQTVRMEYLTMIADIARAGEVNPAVGVAFRVNRENYRSLPEVLNFCVDHRIEHLLLPMQRLMTEEQCFLFSKEERSELTARLSVVDKPSWLRITIHDPFLWRAFFPKVAFPNGGCQAANTMLYISPGAEVYSCPTLPIRIGDLKNTSLRDVIRSGLKKEIRNKLVSMPPGCEQCGDLGQCKGGCRGRAYALHDSWEKPDPSCA